MHYWQQSKQIYKHIIDTVGEGNKKMSLVYKEIGHGKLDSPAGFY